MAQGDVCANASLPPAGAGEEELLAWFRCPKNEELQAQQVKMSKLAQDMIARGRPEQAVEIYCRALKQPSPIRASLVRMLAYTYHKTKDSPSALLLLERLGEMEASLLGQEDPQNVCMRALALGGCGKVPEGLALLDSSIAKYIEKDKKAAALDWEDWDTIDAKACRANLWAFDPEHAKGLMDVWNDIIDRRKKRAKYGVKTMHGDELDEKQSATLEAFRSSGAVHVLLGQTPQIALPIYERTLQACERNNPGVGDALGKPSRERADLEYHTVLQLVSLYYCLGTFAKADSLLSGALLSFREELGADDPCTLNMEKERGDCAKLMAMRKSCQKCGKEYDKEDKVVQCSKTHLLTYCNRECQKEHWPEIKGQVDQWMKAWSVGTIREGLKDYGLRVFIPRIRPSVAASADRQQQISA